MNVIVVEPPLVEPVEMSVVFEHLRLDDADEPEAHPQYAMLVSELAAARERAEQVTRRAFVQQTIRLIQGPAHKSNRRSWDYVYAGGCSDWGQIELPRPPFIEMVSVRYYDSANVLQTVDPTLYFATAEFVPKLMFASTFSTPFTYLRGDSIQIDYKAGYAPAVTTPADPDADPPVSEVLDYRANIPEGIKQAILIDMQLQYDDLTPDQRDALGKAYDSLLSSFRVHTF